MTTTAHHELRMNSPVGPLRLVAEGDALTAVLFGDGPEHAAPRAPRAAPHPVLERAREQLDAYFAGERLAFDLPLSPAGTAFQRDVWTALRAIPFGETRAYSAIAASVGRPRACRAVGAASSRNPIAIVVPCHRVIGASGALVGYAGGEWRKRWLLEHERRVASERRAPEHARFAASSVAAAERARPATRA